MAVVKNKKKKANRGVLFPRSDALLRNLIENAAVATFLADAKGKVRYANPAFADLLGYEPAELIGLGMKDLIHPDDFETAKVQAGVLVERKDGGYLAERRYLRKNGE